MRPFRLAGRWGSQILPLGTRPPICHACLRPLPLYYSRRLQTNTATPLLDSNSQPVKRKRGRPRKNETLQSSITPAAATASATQELPGIAKDDGKDRESANMPTGIPDPKVMDPELGAASQQSEYQQPGPELLQARIKHSPYQTSSEISSEPPSGHPIPLEQLPSPPPHLATSSAKLSALHARLALPSQLPLTTLARCLIDRTADPDPRFNNSALSHLGNDLLGYHMGEHLLVQYPRLPFVVLTSAMNAYVGSSGLSSVAQGWGVEAAAEPGGEVDPGLLQFRRTPPAINIDNVDRLRDCGGLVYDDPSAAAAQASRESPTAGKTATLDHAAATLVRALAGAVYLHAGADEVYAFFEAHVLSRRLDVASMFTFTAPTRDLSRLCAREGFQSPVARLESETGRLSRAPAYVVGVYSGKDKLGEGVGASLNEGRFRAAVSALKGWYLYSPVPVAPGGKAMVPSVMEREEGRGKTWVPAFVDAGEVVA